MPHPLIVCVCRNYPRWSGHPKARLQVIITWPECHNEEVDYNYNEAGHALTHGYFSRYWKSVDRDRSALQVATGAFLRPAILANFCQALDRQVGLPTKINIGKLTYRVSSGEFLKSSFTLFCTLSFRQSSGHDNATSVANKYKVLEPMNILSLASSTKLSLRMWMGRWIPPVWCMHVYMCCIGRCQSLSSISCTDVDVFDVEVRRVGKTKKVALLKLESLTSSGGRSLIEWILDWNAPPFVPDTSTSVNQLAFFVAFFSGTWTVFGQGIFNRRTHPWQANKVYLSSLRGTQRQNTRHDSENQAEKYELVSVRDRAKWVLWFSFFILTLPALSPFYLYSSVLSHKLHGHSTSNLQLKTTICATTSITDNVTFVSHSTNISYDDTEEGRVAYDDWSSKCSKLWSRHEDRVRGGGGGMIREYIFCSYLPAGLGLRHAMKIRWRSNSMMAPDDPIGPVTGRPQFLPLVVKCHLRDGKPWQPGPPHGWLGKYPTLTSARPVFSPQR